VVSMEKVVDEFQIIEEKMEEKDSLCSTTC
jgi:hypothetical protein